MAEPIYRYGIKLTPRGNHNLQFRKPKLEIGTVATDWSPAPEDPDKDAMELISVLQTDFSVVQGQIQAKVWETDIEKATEGVYENITELYSYINETINGITAEVGNLTYVVDENYQSLTAELANLTIETNNITSTVINLETSINGILNPANILRHTNDGEIDRPYDGSCFETSTISMWNILKIDDNSISLPAGIYYVRTRGNSCTSTASFDYYFDTGFHWTVNNNVLIDNTDNLVEGSTYTFSFYISSEETGAIAIYFDDIVYGQTVLGCSLDTYDSSLVGQYGLINTNGNLNDWTRIWVTFRLDDKENFKFGPSWGYNKNLSSNTYAYFCGFMLNEGTIVNWDDGENAYFATTSYVMSQIEQLAGSIKLEVSSASNGSAFILMTVDGESVGAGDILANGVRQAFENDTTAIVISAGTVAFDSNTFIVNSTYFSVTASGVITATSGTIGGFTINENALFNNLSDTDDSTANGIYLGKKGIRVNGQYAGVRMNAQNANDTYGGGIYFYHYYRGFCGAIYPSSGETLTSLSISYADNTDALYIETRNNSHEIYISCDSFVMNHSEGYTGTINSPNSLRFVNGLCVSGY